MSSLIDAASRREMIDNSARTMTSVITSVAGMDEQALLKELAIQLLNNLVEKGAGLAVLEVLTHAQNCKETISNNIRHGALKGGGLPI